MWLSFLCLIMAMPGIISVISLCVSSPPPSQDNSPLEELSTGSTWSASHQFWAGGHGSEIHYWSDLQWLYFSFWIWHLYPTLSGRILKKLTKLVTATFLKRKLKKKNLGFLSVWKYLIHFRNYAKKRLKLPRIKNICVYVYIVKMTAIPPAFFSSHLSLLLNILLVYHFNVCRMARIWIY